MRWPWSRSRLERGSAGADATAGERSAAPGGSGGVKVERGLDGAGVERRSGELHLVKVAYAANLPEAELIQGLLRQERIPSMIRRNGGFDVPDLISAGPRDILVPVSQADRARELLA